MTWQEKILEKVKNIKCLKKERGSIFVLTAMLLPIMLGCLGIAYDVGNIYIHKARLQNVTDAAALAGGRAYLQSQLKETDKDTYDNYTSGNSKDEEYVIGGSKTRVRRRPGEDIAADGDIYSFHLDADNAADDYIYNNIKNLGNTVYSDKFSHYALPGHKKIGEDYVNADEIFYRIGLYEIVPLYFLPIITNKYFEKVRAGSVVVVKPGTTEVIHGGGGTSTSVSYSMFDNLFTYSDEFISRHTSHENDSTPVSYTEFVGDMVYTHGNGTYSIFYDLQDKYLTHHYYESVGSTSNNNKNDPIIDTTFSTLAYVEALTTEKLKQPHVSYMVANTVPNVKVSDINNPDSSLYKTSIQLSDGNMVYQETQQGIIYVGEKSSASNGWQPKYFVFDEDAGDYAYVKGAEHNEQNKIQYIKFNNKMYRFVKQDGKNYFVNENLEKLSCYTIDNDWQTYNPNNETLPEMSGNFDFNIQDQYVYTKTVHSNIFYFCDGFDLTIDEALRGYDNQPNSKEPIYIIVDQKGENANDPFRLFVNASNVRPLIIVSLRTMDQFFVEYGSSDVTFSGVIYAPYQTKGIHFNNSGTLLGNVIGYKLDIENAGESHWIQKNFLESDDFTDIDVAKVTQEIAEANQNNGLTDEIKAEIRSTLNIPEGIDMGDMNYYNDLSYNAKQQFYRSWKGLYEKYKNNDAVRNHLWPWNQHFDIQSGEDQIVTTDEKLRLINYRTEYQPKDDMEDGWVLDPYIFETLGAPNSY